MWGPKKEVAQSIREVPCLPHHTADRWPDHTIGAALASPGQAREPSKRGQGAPSGSRNLLSFSRGWGFRSSQFGAPSDGDKAEQCPMCMLVGR